MTRLEEPPGGIRQKLHRNHVVTPTYIRSFCWQTAKQILGHDLALLLQGRIGELKKYTTAMSYDDLVFQLDEKYSVWKQFIDELVENRVLDIEESLERARRIRDKRKVQTPNTYIMNYILMIFPYMVVIQSYCLIDGVRLIHR